MLSDYSKIFLFLITTITLLINNSKCATLSNSMDMMITTNCPYQCVCQNSHFMDLSIARWIYQMQMGLNNKQQQSSDKIKLQQQQHQQDLVNDNEALYDGDESYLINPIVKLATCILQPQQNPKEFINSLPHDTQALIILYTGEGINTTVSTSDLKILNQLTTLEIRGTTDRSFHLIMDEPLSFIQNVNFESIELVGSDKAKRPNNPIHPSESFDYVPNSEKVAYNLSLETEEEIEILPYEVYVMEIKKSRMASYYGWDNLEILRIHNCKLDELYWEMFDGLTQLQHLSLEHNEIKIIPAFALYGALHIKTLSLAHNHILDLNYRSLAGLLELEVLDLSYNNMTKLSEMTFPPFPKLEQIDFRHNPIRYIFPATFGVMNNTKTMFIGSKEIALELIANNPFESLGFLKFLSILNISTDIIDQSIFKGLNSLEILKLKGSIQKIEFDAFANMGKLRELDLNQCEIQVISMDAFIGCKKLEIVDLSNNNLSYIPPGLFDDQKSLKEIYLNGNNLRYLPSNFFTNSALKLVRLIDNPWKCTCDMAVWKPEITNSMRGIKQESCIHDFMSGKQITCRTYDNYKFDNKLSPRCSNIKDHSVYYALRKDLQCNFRKEFDRQLKLTSNSGKRGSKFKHLTEKKQKHKERVLIQAQHHENENEIMERREQWNRNRSDKIKKTLQDVNSIEYLSKTNNALDTKFLSNHILGDIDEHSSFNHI